MNISGTDLEKHLKAKNLYKFADAQLQDILK